MQSEASLQCTLHSARPEPAARPILARRSHANYDAGMTIAGWAMMAVGLVAYLLAFAQGPGPAMGDRPLQASLFTLATILLIAGFVLVAVV